MSSTKATFDTGSSFNYLPPGDFDTFYKAINKDNLNKCESISGILYCNENIFHKTYKNITLMLNEETIITMHPRYFMEYDFDIGAWMIKVAAPRKNLDHWVLGAPFLQ